MPRHYPRQSFAPVSSSTYVYGTHAIVELLKNTPKALEKIFLEGRAHKEVSLLAQQQGIKILPLDAAALPPGMDAGALHQGVVALVATTKLLRPYREFMDGLRITPDTCLVVLGELEDPQNVGAIIRSAAAFGVAGILLPKYHQAPITGTVAKVSAGMAFRVPLIEITNVNTALRDLKDRKFWIYGLDMAGNPIGKETFDAPAVFVLGSEGRGLRQKTEEECDILLSIPMHPACESLNAAASGAVALYAWSTQHPKALTVPTA